MGKIDITKGQILHKKGDVVKDVAIILKGSFLIKNDEDITLKADNGSILGAFQKCGEAYKYDYVANEDSTLFVYDYNSEAELIEAINATASVAPAMASATINLLNNMIDVLASLHEKCEQLCKKLKNDYSNYKNICAELMVMPKNFDTLNILFPPAEPAILSSWEADFYRAYRTKNDLLRQEYYPADINFCIGTIMLAAKMAQEIQPQIEAAADFIHRTKLDNDAFIKEYQSQTAKLDNAKRQEAMEAGSGNLPKIKNALRTILAFADIDQEISDTFTKDLKKFMSHPDKTEKSGEMRALRQRIADNFYTIYEAAFFKSLETENVPAEVNMFFFFGFVDEEMAGEDNTAALYKYALLWEDDPEGTILPTYKWLQKVYTGEVLPSKDEFDNDWGEHLKEEVRQGNVTQAQADAMLNDPKAKVSYELRNMIASANKMTFGSVFSFIPVFYAQQVNRPLEACLSSVERVRQALNKIRSIDFGCFYRPAYTSFTELKINRYVYNIEILPYIILMPNFGSRGVMWQEIEGRVRTSPAHMMFSIFHSEDIENTMVTVCAQFRWEMCKRIQGVHYSDISDPSLTSEYVNYLQFYKKNSDLTADMKEAVRAALKKYGNNYRNIFTSEYEIFINNESNGILRLNRVAREILFKYCTFSKAYRDKLSINPQYRKLMDAWRISQDEKEHTLDLFSRKILTMVDELPEEVKLETEYLKL
ncbi:MAG: hypothetical protein E7197_10375 [Anaerovibrio sp.]|uniref:hypothetical protein n=1 Tax=Anaerovibrio sp. TaxID=1872532 RepID=UPI0025C63238|nr:hypothetical protein [Anaerovibrio sp.]MBE6100438.1 hypothetical protein [Anaerovibrio sp.]